MSDTFIGFVVKVTTKSGKNKRGRSWTAYSMKLSDKDGDELKPWFQCGFKDPGLNEGDYIKFSAEKKDDSAYTVDVDSIKVSKNPPARKTAEKRSTGGSTGSASGGYNSDTQRADRAYHASRGNAVDLVNVLLTHNALPVSASQGKAGKAKRFDEVMAFVDKLTVQFFRDEFPEGFEDQFRLLDAVADAGEERVDQEGDGDLPDSQPDDDFDDDFNDDDDGGDDDDPAFD